MMQIASPAYNRAVLTLAEIKAAVGETTPANDAALTDLALAVSDLVSDLCGIQSDGVNPATILSEEVVEVIRIGSPRTTLPLTRRFVSSVDSVKIDGETLSSSEYDIDAASGVLRYLNDAGGYAYWPVGKIEIAYTAGFETAPNPVKMAAKMVAREAWTSEGRDPLLRSENHDGYGAFTYFRPTILDKSVSSAIVDMLAPYRSVPL